MGTDFHKALLAVGALLSIQCASLAPGGPALTTSRFAATPERPTALAGADLDASACVEIGRERIVRLAYVFPLNELTADELLQDERPARRMRVDFTAADAGLSLLGFLFGVVTETQIAESCDSAFAVIAADELARLRAAAAPAPARVAALEPEASSIGPAANPWRAALALSFAFDSAELAPQEAQRLNVFAREHADRAGRWLVVGHADRSGAPARNDPLSLARARGVAAALVRSGVSASAVHALAAGSGWSLGRGVSLDRRVEIFLLPAAEAAP